MKTFWSLVAFLVVNISLQAQTPASESSLKFTSYSKVLPSGQPVSIGETVYWGTSHGVYTTSLNGAHLGLLSESNGLANHNVRSLFNLPDNRLFVLSTSASRNPCVSPLLFETTSEVELFELTETDQFVSRVRLPVSERFGAAVVDDIFGNIWFNTDYESLSPLYRFDGTEFDPEPVLEHVWYIFRYGSTGQVIVEYFTEPPPAGQFRRATFDGEKFVQLPVGPQGSASTGGTWSDSETGAPSKQGAETSSTSLTWVDFLRSFHEYYPLIPENEYFTNVEEGPDGSLWYVGGSVEPICIAGKSRGESGVTPLWWSDYWLQYLQLGSIYRRTASNIERHATYLDNVGDLSYRVQGAFDFALTSSGEPVISVIRYSSLAAGLELPFAWIYSQNNSRNDLLFSPSPQLTSYYLTRNRVFSLGGDRFFIYNDKELFYLDGTNLLELTIPEYLQSMDVFLGFQQIAENRYRIRTQDHHIVMSIDESGFPDVAEINPNTDNSVYVSALDADGSFWIASSEGVSYYDHSTPPMPLAWILPDDTHPTSIFPASTGHVWITTCGSGLFRVHPSSSEVDQFTLRDGLSSNCLLNITEGGSGNLYVSSAHGYTIIGDPERIGGAPLPERFPTSTPETPATGLPSELTLSQNYPNPFNPTTIIAISLPEGSHVTLRVFNIMGQQIGTIAEGYFPTGDHSFTFNAGGLSSGLYIYQLITDRGTLSRSMMLVK